MENCHSGNRRHSFAFTFPHWFLIQASWKYRFRVYRKRAKFNFKEPNLFSGSMVSSLLVFYTGTDFHFIPLRRSIIISSWRTKLAHIISKPRVCGLPFGIYPCWSKSLSCAGTVKPGSKPSYPVSLLRTEKMTIIQILIKRRVISCQMTLARWSESFIVNYYFQAQMHLRKVSVPHFSAVIIRYSSSYKGLVKWQ